MFIILRVLTRRRREILGKITLLLHMQLSATIHIGFQNILGEGGVC
jgi:hypothetical protein